MVNLICPVADSCPIYRNWVEQTKDKRPNIIYTRSSTSSSYYCLALTALRDPTSEGGIMPNDELKARLKNKEADCALVMLLNQTAH